ncbi:DUF4167 domain-containing protein [Methylocystis parvus]|nr:DUF4167 domain-containing protein [Methylocystis parvus]WBJ99948.1 DUF4167 domain-containing protein [Methylocystis parvus OBBP]
MRGRSGRKGPNPLTRSYESNGPDVKIRGTAQHIAEKYLQLARDAQSSGDTIMAESLLQHAEHYFRLIAAAQTAQQQANGFGRPQSEAEIEMEDDDDFAALPDRFAPLSERLPPTVYQAQPQPFMPQQQPQQQQPHFAQPQPQPQPYEERPIGEMRVDMRQERQDRPERMDRGERPQRPPFRERNNEGEPRRFERNRDRRFQRPEASDEPAPGLPSFITAPPARPAVAEAEAPEAGFAPAAERQPAREHEGVNFHLSSRRRRRPPRSQAEEAASETREEAPAPSEVPFEPDRF